MSEVSTWNAVDASNTATPPDGWPEGMQPSAVNDAARMMMGALRREHDNIVAQIGSVAGTISTTTINATTISTTGAITASGPITGSAINSTGNASVAGTLTAGTVTATGTLTAGTVTATGNANIGGTVTAANVNATGNINATGSVNGAYLHSSGNCDIIGNFTAAGITGTYLDITGHADINAYVNTPYVNGGTGGAGTLQMYGTSNRINFRYDTSGASGQVAWRVDNSLERYIGSTVNVFNTFYNAAGGPTGVGFYGADNPGNVYINYVDALSDERIKDNISETSVDALTLLSQVEVSQFDVKGPVAAWIKTIGQDMPERVAAMANAQPVHVPIGFVAQRLKAFVPEAVDTVRQDEQPSESPLPVDVMNVNKAELVPYLVRAIQQLAARVEQLEAGGSNV